MKLDASPFELYSGRMPYIFCFQVVDLLFLLSMLIDSRSFGFKLLVVLLQLLHCDTDVLHIYQNKSPNICLQPVIINIKFDGKIHWKGLKINATFFFSWRSLTAFTIHFITAELILFWNRACEITRKYLYTVFSLSWRIRG